MALHIHDFARLFLAKMADNSLTINFNQPENKYADIPFNYRERIENILCANNGWKEEFSTLIDVDEYFKDHFYWERVFADELLKVAKELDKDFIFDIASEYMSIVFSKKEVNKILSNYDHGIVEIMDHFVNLVIDAIYSREFQEQFTDYTARSREKMHAIHDNQEKIDFVWVHLFDKVYLLTDKNHYDEQNKKWVKTPAIMYGYAVVHNFVSFRALSDEAKTDYGKIKKTLIELVNRGRSTVTKLRHNC